MSIRPALQTDIPQLMAMNQAAGSAATWSQQQWMDIFHTQIPTRLAWIADPDSAEPGTGGIGFLVAQNLASEWELENIAVLPSFRRQGFGGTLLSALLAHASSVRAERVLLEVRVSNLSAIRLYGSSGFQPLARRPNYYRNPDEDALIMVHTFEI